MMNTEKGIWNFEALFRKASLPQQVFCIRYSAVRLAVSTQAAEKSDRENLKIGYVF
jgi:hypothetical protein